MESFGEAIKAMREKQKLPQRVVAYKLNIDVAVLSKIENDNKLPRKRLNEIIYAVSELFGVPEKELLRIYKSDIIANILIDEADIDKVLKESSLKVEHLRLKNTIQSKLDL